ncbi:ATP-binding cassette domain-containing protein [Nonomuraea sp. NPDC049709]|uniref:ATP-binding cassette domain-containing protein n=1 Tax=Nonomuraea sp. NPDC049709 TaxID=3154736 RepID=UPI00342B6A71
MIVQVSGLRAEVDGRALVDGVSFELATGEVLALVGASGSGKTTTGLALLGEHAPGVRLSGEVRRAPGAVAYVPQHPSSVLNPARRVGGVLREIARHQSAGEVPRLDVPQDLAGDVRARRRRPPWGRAGEAEERVREAARRARLPVELLGRYPHQLSGGQQQRVVLAQALLLDPVLIVADEPTTGQDGLIRGEVIEEFRGLRAQGIALVLLSHDLAMVRALADRVAVMHGGRIVESGPAAAVLDAPRHDYTQRLLSTRLAPPSRPTSSPAHPASGAPAPATGRAAGDSAETSRREHAEDGSTGQANAGSANRTGGGDVANAAPAESGSAGASWAAQAEGHVANAAPVESGGAEGALREGGRSGGVEAGPGGGVGGLVEVRGLVAGHRRMAVLRGVSLSVAAGECVAVVGRSGSGKTTLARCVAGLHRAAAGTVTLAGRPLPRHLPSRARDVQYVFQDARASFDPYRSVSAQVARTAVRLRGASAGEAAAGARAVLERVGLDERTAGRRPAALSGGELQRAALARALLAEPKVLICDEITSGLDTLVQAAILDLLDELRRDLGLTLLLISHDMDVVARLADRVVELDGGRVRSENSP